MAEEMMDSPMHAQLYNSLKDWFTGGFSLSDRLPTEQDIMQRFAVGRGTVRAALNELVRDGIVIRTPGRGSFLAPDYLVRLRRYSVAILLSEREFSGSDNWEYSWHNHMEMLNGVMKEALTKNISLEIISEGAIGPELNDAFDAFISFRYIREGTLSVLRKPVIPFHYELDMAGGLAGIVRHLVDSGYRTPAYIGTARAGRISFINSFLHMNGLSPLSGELIVECSGTSRDGYEACSALLEKELRPDCIICSTDMRALGVLSCLRERGIAVPDDLGVYGFDGMRESESCSPGLTTWAFPWQELGVRAVHELRSRLDGVGITPYEALKGSLCVRESTTIRSGGDVSDASDREITAAPGIGTAEKEGRDRRIVSLDSCDLDFFLTIGKRESGTPADSGKDRARLEWTSLVERCLKASEREGGTAVMGELLALPDSDGSAASSGVRYRRGTDLPVLKARSGAVVWEGTVMVEALDYPLPAFRLSGPEYSSLLRNTVALLESWRQSSRDVRSCGLVSARDNGLFRICLVFYRAGACEADDGPADDAASRVMSAAGALSRVTPPGGGDDLSRWIEDYYRRIFPGGIFTGKNTEEILSLFRRE